MTEPLPQDPIPFRKVNELDRQILTALVETGGVSFEGIGKTIAQVGSESVFADDGWIRWCGSDLRIYRWPGPRFDLENLLDIRRIVGGERLG